MSETNDRNASAGWARDTVIDVLEANSTVSIGRVISKLASTHYRAACAKGLAEMCEMVLERWTFDENQRHTHTWHDMQDCAFFLNEALAEWREAVK